MISHDEIAAVLDRVLGGRASPLLLNFLKVVSRHGRLDCLRAIHRRVHALYDILQNRVRVRLTTATPLSAELASRIRIALRGKLEGEPVLELATDPELDRRRGASPGRHRLRRLDRQSIANYPSTNDGQECP